MSSKIKSHLNKEKIKKNLTRPSVADSKYNLALLHKKRKETDIARQLFLECEQIYTIVYGPHHRETVDAVRQASLCV